MKASFPVLLLLLVTGGTLCRAAPAVRIPLVEQDSFDGADNQPPEIYKPEEDVEPVFVPKDPNLDRAVIQQIKKTVGVMERPINSNRGPEVDAYLRFCDVNPPAYWCAAYVAHQIHRAAGNPQAGGTRSPRLKTRWRKHANCNDIYKWAKRNELLIASPGVPSVFLIRRGDRYRHTGFVESVSRDGKVITTIEGNSNNNGSSNGIGVFRLRRKVKPTMAFVKIS